MHNDTSSDEDVIHYKRIILRMAAEETAWMYFECYGYDINVYDGFAAGAVDKLTLANVLVCVDVPCCGKCVYTTIPKVRRKHFYISYLWVEFSTFVTHFLFEMTHKL